MATGLFSGSSARKRFVDAPVEDQINELRDEIASLASLLSQRGSDVRTKAQDAREHTEASLHDLIENGEQLLAELRSRYALTEKQVRHTVREHPVATLGAAAALGLLIAALIRR
ncbi:hypothetical protein [Pararhizobium sp. LjRoot238]|uniref:hypothetical protein n=1 Tax=Pararhizobium sp. LjRoot238 TaxID=3342293 RepID=UPI003ECDD27E